MLAERLNRARFIDFRCGAIFEQEGVLQRRGRYCWSRNLHSCDEYTGKLYVRSVPLMRFRVLFCWPACPPEALASQE